MESIRRQNTDLQKGVQNLLEQIEKQKELNSQHEDQIATLLNFNQRLLQIIQKEVNNANKDNISLQPISERSERESDLYIPTLKSMIKPRFTSGAKSESGFPTSQSYIDKSRQSNTKLDQLKIDYNHSQVHYDEEDQVDLHKKQKIASMVKTVQKSPDQKDMVKGEMKKEISGLKKFRDESNQFYENKIKEVRTLGNKMTKYGASQQLNKISQKLNISPSTQSMLQRVLNKTNQ